MKNRSVCSRDSGLSMSWLIQASMPTPPISITAYALLDWSTRGASSRSASSSCRSRSVIPTRSIGEGDQLSADEVQQTSKEGIIEAIEIRQMKLPRPQIIARREQAKERNQYQGLPEWSS